MPTPYSFLRAQRLLILPFNRLGFSVAFILATALSQVIARFLYSQPVVSHLLAQNFLMGAVITGIISGTLFGTAQWLVLRKYIPDRKWILAAVIFFTCGTLLKGWSTSIDPFAGGVFFPLDFSLPNLILNSALIFILSLGLVFVYGYLQWYVLRPYIHRARWWILLPFWKDLVFGIPALLSLIASNYLPANLSSAWFNLSSWLFTEVLRLTALPTIQAIGFCLLKRNRDEQVGIPQSSLASQPDILSYWKIRKLQKSLHVNISKKWGTDLSQSLRPLQYFVGISENGEVLEFEPTNSTASEHVSQTPLPQLVNSPANSDLAVTDAIKLAKFNVIFIPPGVLKVQSWRGIPILWLSLFTFAAIIGTGALCKYFQFSILPE